MVLPFCVTLRSVQLDKDFLISDQFRCVRSKVREAYFLVR